MKPAQVQELPMRCSRAREHAVDDCIGDAQLVDDRLDVVVLAGDDCDVQVVA